MTMVIRLAELVEDNFNMQCKNAKPLAWMLSSFQSGPKPPHFLPMKCLTLAKMEDYKKKGLYYNYDKKISPGHLYVT